jgi:predicted ATPase/DNA-binding SARP family transcriptional activator
MNIEDPLRITLLGKININQGDHQLTNFRHRKTLALLAYLATTGKRHSRESLAGLLWGNTTDANALGGLRKVLAELRSLIGPYLLEQDRQVAFNAALPFQADVLDFEKGLRDIHTHKVELLDAATITLLQEALDLYQGDFLPGFYIQHAPAFEEWVNLTRERLRLTAFDGLFLVSKAAYRHSDYPTSIRYTRRLLELEPANEEAHRLLMSLLALSGQREAALQQYELCRNLLKQTYQLSPQAETTDLFQRIREEPSERGPKNNLPPMPASPLIGRQPDLDALQKRLREKTCRLLTILGSGGCGKTHLALALAAEIEKQSDDPYPDGLVFVPLSSLDSIESLPSAIAHQLGFQFHKESSPLQQLEEYLSSRRVLLILDNFEHLINHPANSDAQVDQTMLSQIIQQAPQVKILVTSRVRLNLLGEQVYPLKGISYPEKNISGITAKPSPAVELFKQSAQRIAPDIKWDARSLTATAEICRQVQGSPLGILLAAGWVHLLAPHEIAAQLSRQNGFQLLENEAEDFPARQRSLNAVLTYSWRLLSTDEQRVLSALSVFRGTFSLPAAQEVSGASLTDLRTLIDHSLLHRTAEGRYAMHEFTRQFANQKLDDPQKVHNRLWDFYGNRLTAWAKAIQSARQLEAVESMDAEIDNIRSAWELAINTHKIDFLAQAIEGMASYYNWRYRYAEGLSALQALRGYLQDQIGLDGSNELIKARHLLAKTLAWQVLFTPQSQAEEPLRLCITILDELEEPGNRSAEFLETRAFAYNQLGNTLAQSGRNAEAKDILEQSTRISADIGNEWLYADTLRTLASVLWDLSEYEQAEANITKSLQLYKKIGDNRGTAASLSWLGINMLIQGDTQGEQFIRESIAIYNTLGDRMRVVDGIELAAISLMILGKFEEARSLLEEIGNIDNRFILRNHAFLPLLASVYTHLGQYDRAKEYALSGMAEARKSGTPFVKGFALITRGWSALAENEDQLAYDLFKESAALCEKYATRDLSTWALAFQGFTAYRLGKIESARLIFKQAAQIAIEINAFVGKVFIALLSLPVAAQGDQGEIVQAAYAKFKQFSIVANSVFLDHILGQRMEALIAEQPPESFEESSKRGSTVSIDEILASVLSLL